MAEERDLGKDGQRKTGRPLPRRLRSEKISEDIIERVTKALLDTQMFVVTSPIGRVMAVQDLLMEDLVDTWLEEVHDTIQEIKRDDKEIEDLRVSTRQLLASMQAG